MNEDLQQREFQERFNAALETWRFQINAYWTRTAYFSLFQIAAFTGLWSTITAHHHRYSAVFLSLLACCFALIWFVSSLRMHQYVDYWWQRAAAIEAEFHVTPQRSLVQHHRDHTPTHRMGRSRDWIKALPLVFLAAWLWMLLWSLHSVWQYRS